MASGDIKKLYSSVTSLTVTVVNSLAASSTLVAGAEIGPIDNSSPGYDDISLGVQITVGASGVTAGLIRVYAVPQLTDSTWPDVFDGTASAETVTSVDILEASAFLVASSAVAAVNSRVYYLACPSLKQVLGQVPRQCVLFVTHSSTAALAASGNGCWWQGSYYQVQP
jgi:hypothetical protein